MIYRQQEEIYQLPTILKRKKEKNKRIGIDLDNTLVYTIKDTVKIAAANLGMKKPPKSADYTHSNLSEELKEEIHRLYDDPEHACSIVPLPGAINKMLQWKKEEREIIIITAGNEPIRKARRILINEFFPMVDGLRFVNIYQSKKDIFIEERIDTWIDDSPRDTPIAYNIGLDTYLISNSDTQYNWKLKAQCPFKVYSSISNINFY